MRPGALRVLHPCYTMPTYNITFPSIHGPGRGVDFRAQADAGSYDHAVRAVLEACAAQGVELDYVVLADLPDLRGAKLEGLKLTNCRLQSVVLTGASLRGARIEHTTFDRVHADHSTHLDGAVLEAVRFVGCSLNGMVAKGLQGRALRFEDTTAIGVDVENAEFMGVRTMRSVLVSWRIRAAYLGSFEGAPNVIESADATPVEKHLARELVNGTINRAHAADVLARLESQDTQAAA